MSDATEHHHDWFWCDGRATCKTCAASDDGTALTSLIDEQFWGWYDSPTGWRTTGGPEEDAKLDRRMKALGKEQSNFNPECVSVSQLSPVQPHALRGSDLLVDYAMPIASTIAAVALITVVIAGMYVLMWPVINAP